MRTTEFIWGMSECHLTLSGASATLVADAGKPGRDENMSVLVKTTILIALPVKRAPRGARV